MQSQTAAFFWIITPFDGKQEAAHFIRETACRRVCRDTPDKGTTPARPRSTPDPATRPGKVPQGAFDGVAAMSTLRVVRRCLGPRMLTKLLREKSQLGQMHLAKIARTTDLNRIARTGFTRPGSRCAVLAPHGPECWLHMSLNLHQVPPRPRRVPAS